MDVDSKRQYRLCRFTPATASKRLREDWEEGGEGIDCAEGVK